MGRNFGNRRYAYSDNKTFIIRRSMGNSIIGVFVDSKGLHIYSG